MVTQENSNLVEKGDLSVSAKDLIRINAGEFLMGTSNRQVQFMLQREAWAEEWYQKDMFRVEQPQHVVKLEAFDIAHLPVTNEEYTEFLMDTNHRFPREWTGFTYPEETGDHPITGISKADTLKFCEWLSALSGRTFRLPTEAEWERAARGTDGRIFPWGQEFDPWRCNTKESGKRSPSPVGSYSPRGDSPDGVADMTGNVMEWTSSFLLDYPYKKEQDPGKNPVCVVRGGSWYYSHKLARCAAREGMIPTMTSPTLGFRVASDAS